MRPQPPAGLAEVLYTNPEWGVGERVRSFHEYALDVALDVSLSLDVSRIMLFSDPEAIIARARERIAHDAHERMRDATERSSLSTRMDRLESQFGVQVAELAARVAKLEHDATAGTTERQRLLGAISQIQTELSSYEIEDMENLVVHVSERPSLSSLLSQSADELRTRFQSGCLSLQSSDERLLLVVETELEVEEAERRFSSFLREWWNKKVELEDRISITLRYV